MESLPRRVDARLSVVGSVGNGVGGLVVVAFLLFVFPSTLDSDQVAEVTLRSVILFGVLLAVALPIGRELIQRRPLRAIIALVDEPGSGTEAERRRAFRYPLAWALRSFAVWVFGAIVSVAVNASIDFAVAIASAITVVLGGLTACSLQYLLVERVMRPFTALVLAGGSPPGGVVPGVGARVTMAWMLATGVPVLGLAALAGFRLGGVDFDIDQLLGAFLFLAALILTAGLAATVFAARSVAEPLRSMRDALARVEAGDLATEVAVDDASEVGLLQAGFNRMTAGLAERERIREAFGTYVDREVAEHILREGTSLAGEEVEVTMMFVDIRDFTGYAEHRPAAEVVATVNRLWETVVPIVHQRFGHVDKFVGDGLLAVFGAPRRLDDHADQAVAAALEIASAVKDEFGAELSIGAGLNSGTVVAGNVGGGGRLEFSVIGDAVNVAARVEAATRKTGDVVLLAENVKRLLCTDGVRLEPRPDVPLKGKTESIMLYAPLALEA